MPNPTFAAQLGMQAASQATSGIFGLLMGNMENKRQLAQQERLQQLQIKGSKELSDYQLQQQMKLWEQTNYKAQMEQLEKAGLNPALLYGMSGGGGTTAAAAAGGMPTSTQPHKTPILESMGMGMQMQLMNAQRRDLEASAKLKEAQADKTSGVDTQEAQTRIQSMTQGIQNQKAQEALTWVQREIAQVQASVQRQTMQEAMETITNLAHKTYEEVRELRIENDLSTEQFKDKVKLLKMEIAQIAVHNALMNAQKENVNQDTKNKIQEILESQQRVQTMAGQLMIAWDKLSLDTNQQRINWETYLEDDSWNFLKDMLPTWLIPIGKGFRAERTPIKGFNR